MKKRKLKTLDLILLLMGVFLLLFTVTMIVLWVTTGGVPDTLIGCVFGACIGEAGITGMITNTKNKQAGNPAESEDKL